jgi:hypothetical protein
MEANCSTWTDRQTDLQAGRQTDMTKLIFTFRNFENVPKTQVGILVKCTSL